MSSKEVQAFPAKDTSGTVVLPTVSVFQSTALWDRVTDSRGYLMRKER